MATKVKSFRLPDEAIDIVENLKEKYGKTEGEIVKEAVLNTNQLVKSLENQLQAKDREIRALYAKIGELKGQSEIKTLLIEIRKDINKPLWRRIFG